MNNTKDCGQTDPNILCRSISCERCKAIRLENKVDDIFNDAYEKEKSRTLLDTATVKSLFPKVKGLPTSEGWYLFIPKDISNWIVQLTFVYITFNKGELCVVEDGDYIQFKNWYKGRWYGPVQQNKITEILKDE